MTRRVSAPKDNKLERFAEAVRANDDGRSAFVAAMEAEMNAAMQSWGDQLAKNYWGDCPPLNYTPPKVTTWMRIRWAWRSVRQGMARAALWVLRVDAGELCDCDY